MFGADLDRGSPNGQCQMIETVWGLQQLELAPEPAFSPATGSMLSIEDLRENGLKVDLGAEELQTPLDDSRSDGKTSVRSHGFIEESDGKLLQKSAENNVGAMTQWGVPAAWLPSQYVELYGVSCDWRMAT